MDVEKFSDAMSDLLFEFFISELLYVHIISELLDSGDEGIDIKDIEDIEEEFDVASGKMAGIEEKTRELVDRLVKNNAYLLSGKLNDTAVLGIISDLTDMKKESRYEILDFIRGELE